MIKYTALTLQLVIFSIVIYVFYVNMSNMSDISFVKNAQTVAVSTSIAVITAYFTGLITGIMQSIVNKSVYRNQIEFYARKNEKLSQQNEIDTDDKEALERKIATLEIALQNALKNKN